MECRSEGGRREKGNKMGRLERDHERQREVET